MLAVGKQNFDLHADFGYADVDMIFAPQLYGTFLSPRK